MYAELLDKIRKSEEMKRWRGTILGSNKLACIWCGSRERLEIDHKVPLSVLVDKYGIHTLDSALRCDGLFDMSNGRILCYRCHTRKTKRDARRYGWKLSWLKPCKPKAARKKPKRKNGKLLRKVMARDKASGL